MQRLSHSAGAVATVCLLLLLSIVAADTAAARSTAASLTWHAPFFSGGGYCTEATAFLLAVHAHRLANGNTTQFSINHHGDSQNGNYLSALRPIEAQLLQEYQASSGSRRYTQTTAEGVWIPAAAEAASKQPPRRQQIHIDVCHSEPGAWYAPYPKYQTSPCPPKKSSVKSAVAQYTVGRTMFETDRIPDGWLGRLNFMDEIWVPTEFAKQIFISAGVPAEKLTIVAEPVDTDFFRPMLGAEKASAFFAPYVQEYMTYSSSSNGRGSGNTFLANEFLHTLSLPQQEQIASVMEAGDVGLQNLIELLLQNGRNESPLHSGRTAATIMHRNGGLSEIDNSGPTSESDIDAANVTGIAATRPTVFLYVGKFEQRKGIDLLLDAYMNEFASEAEDVLLVMLTSAYHSTTEFDREIEKLLPAAEKGDNVAQRPRYHVLTGLPQLAMPYLYSLADALVIPSHGEGFGRPHVEAMSCGTPVIATNWSSIPSFITNKRNGLLIEIEDELVPAAGWRGHLWAQPKAASIRTLLREVHSDRAAAAALGAAARSTMIDRYSLEIMGGAVVKEMERIGKKLQTATTDPKKKKSASATKDGRMEL